MQYATAALDCGINIRDFVVEKVTHAKTILSNMLQEMLQETAPAKQAALNTRIRKCRTQTVYIYIVDALAILFNEDPLMKALEVKNKAVIITRTYKSVKPCITHVRYCPQNARNDSDAEVATFANSTGLPVVWVECREDYAVVVEGNHVYRQSKIEDSFVAFLASFAMFDIDWCRNSKVCSRAYISIILRLVH